MNKAMRDLATVPGGPWLLMTGGAFGYWLWQMEGSSLPHYDGWLGLIIALA